MFSRLRTWLRRDRKRPPVTHLAASESWDQALAAARHRARWDPGLAKFTAMMSAAGFDDPTPPGY